MLKKEMFENLAMAQVVNIILYLVWILVLYDFGGDFIRLPRVIPAVVASKSAMIISNFLFKRLTEIAFIWILIHIHMIIRSIVRGEAFHARNPKRFRKIAYGVFSLAVIVPLPQLYFLGGEKIRLKMLPGILVFVMAFVFFGAITLMIGEAFSKGAKLQEEQKLTI